MNKKNKTEKWKYWLIEDEEEFILKFKDKLGVEIIK